MQTKTKTALDKLVLRIFPVYTEDAHIPLSVQIIPGKTVNAFASLNGKIFIFEGLLKEAQSPEELTGVLSHEIEHVKRRHVLEGVTTGVLSFLFMPDFGTGSQLASQLLKLKFNRTQEEEADFGGLERLKKAQVNAIGFKNFFDRMESQGSSVSAIISDHPASDARAKMTEAYLHDPSTPVLSEDEWVNLKKACSRSN